MNRADALAAEYGCWGEHPDYPENDWVYEVVEGNTRLGYWPWVAVKIDGEDLF